MLIYNAARFYTGVFFLNIFGVFPVVFLCSIPVLQKKFAHS